MQGFTIQRLGLRIRNSWVTDGLSEVLSTFILALFVFSSNAQYMLTHGEASSATGKALAASVGLTIAVYAGMRAAGGSANPNVSLMFCLLGKMKWKKLPVYIIAEMVGAYLAATVTYFVYEDLINAFEGRTHRQFDMNSTVTLFAGFPHPNISKTTGFFDSVTGTALLTGSIAAITDPNNAGVSRGLIPLVFMPMLYGILMTFGVNTGASINTAIDVSGRIFAYSVGYGSQVFTHAGHWAWVPPLGGLVGAILGPFIYQLMVGNHLALDLEYYGVEHENGRDIPEMTNGQTVDLKDYKSNQSLDTIRTVSTIVEKS